MGSTVRVKQSCQSLYRSDVRISSPCGPAPINGFRLARVRLFYCVTPWLVPLGKRMLGSEVNNKPRPPKESKLGLRPGDWIRVRSEEEIRSTLNPTGHLGGLKFMPEMWRFCGQELKVFKRVQKILLDTTGEMRTINRPTYYLESAYCDGAFHGGCDKSCFLLWREEWLERTEPPDGNRSGDLGAGLWER
jgi:hypothetical protein